jgi:gluconolactonase
MRRLLPFLFLLALAPRLHAQVPLALEPPSGRPDAIVDLATEEGTSLVHGQWRYRDAALETVDAKGPGPDMKPSGAAIKTLDVLPKPGTKAFDDTMWEPIGAATLDKRRGTGKVSFAWYRIKVSLPERIGRLETAGATVAFEVVVDDYAEVWVDGNLPLVLGQSGGAVVRGFNAPNRVVLTRDARPGQEFDVAVFGINGPISRGPDNFIWVRSATLDVYKSWNPSKPVETRIDRRDPALDAVVAPGAKIERLAGGFLFTEGPIWVKDGGYLLFSDPNANTIYRWDPNGSVSVYRAKSGYTGADVGEFGQPGSNGLTLDRDGRLTLDQHGNRRVLRVEKNGVVTVLADRYQGKRLNSPNDLVYRSDGALFFTDPPFGLPKFFDDPRKELSFSGVFGLVNGTLRLVTDELTGPNGIAFSPDEKYLYVGDWDEKKKVVMRYELGKDGSVTSRSVFADLTPEPGEDAIDGIKVDVKGNVYVSGPGGLWIYAPDGKALGKLSGPEHPHNMTFGDADGKTLYLCAQTGLYRLRTEVEGIRP